MLSCEVYLCCPSICSENYLLGCTPSKGNWQTGTSFPTADARQPSSAMTTSASCFHCFPTCSQGSSSCLSLLCLSTRSIWWSWGCSLVRLSYGKAAKKGHHWQVLSWAVRQWDQNVELLSATNDKCVQKCSTPWHLDFLIRFHSLGILETGGANQDHKFNSLFSELSQSYSQHVHLQDYLCKL